MRIFKNRGDIYFSKSNKEKSTEQRILIIALAVIIAFTVVFVLALSIKNDFSAKKFFEPENLNVTNQISADNDDDTEVPDVSGKRNYITLVHKDDELLFAALVQVDMDNTSYKAAMLKAATEIDGNKLNEIYKSSGAENVKKAIDTYIGTEFDYYISMESSNFEEFFNELGTINYPILNDIKYRENDSPASYSLKIKSGEQNISGKHFINLIRYYLDAENSSSQASELLLASLSQQLNGENAQISEKLFREFVSLSDTNISVRDFSLAGDRLSILGNDLVAKGVYNAQAGYDGNRLTDDSLKKIKGYFVK
ncbi:MAG: LCP family protein [Eubacterium sp.]|nr:LCP family protein [Eubacterium sp.]